MKFSDAMLLGLPEIRFSNDRFLIYDPRGKDGKECSGCLVGAALYSVGERGTRYGAQAMLAEYWPWTEAYVPPETCPVCGESLCLIWGLTGFATHLARHYKNKELTAEQIADIFRAVEPAEEPIEQVVETEDEYQCT